jgi:hypothetical protein
MTATTQSWRFTPWSPRDEAEPSVGLSVEDGGGTMAAVARVDIAPRTGRGRLTVRLGPGRPPPEVIGRLVRLVGAIAANAGARSLHVDFDPDSADATEVMAASELDWNVRSCGDHSVADASVGTPAAVGADDS